MCNSSPKYRAILANCQQATKGPSQKYLEANEVKYFSLGGGRG